MTEEKREEATDALILWFVQQDLTTLEAIDIMAEAIDAMRLALDYQAAN